VEKAVIVTLPEVDLAQVALGRRLRRVREARGFCRRRLAEAAELSPVRLGLAEQGRVRLTSAELHAVIGALHISLGLLYSDADVTGLRQI
jgi:transcriptional regulator with XRE-family HTH domain